jgi:hypothetical protein
MHPMQPPERRLGLPRCWFRNEHMLRWPDRTQSWRSLSPPVDKHALLPHLAHAARNAALASSKLSATPPSGCALAPERTIRTRSLQLRSQARSYLSRAEAEPQVATI